MLPSHILFGIFRRVRWAHVLFSDFVRKHNLLRLGLDQLDTLPSRSGSMLDRTTRRATFNRMVVYTWLQRNAPKSQKFLPRVYCSSLTSLN